MEWPGQSSCCPPQICVSARPGLSAYDFFFGVVILLDSSTPGSLRSDVISTVGCPPLSPDGIRDAISASIGKGLQYINLGSTHPDRFLGTPRYPPTHTQLHSLILFSEKPPQGQDGFD